MAATTETSLSVQGVSDNLKFAVEQGAISHDAALQLVGLGLKKGRLYQWTHKWSFKFKLKDGRKFEVGPRGASDGKYELRLENNAGTPTWAVCMSPEFADNAILRVMRTVPHHKVRYFSTMADAFDFLLEMPEDITY